MGGTTDLEPSDDASDDATPSQAASAPAAPTMDLGTTGDFSVPPSPQPSRDDISLLVLSGPCSGLYKKVPDQGGVIGRDPDVEIPIIDPGISREHALLERSESGGFRIIDLDSRYGVYVEAEPTKRRDLVDGDRIQLSGETVLRVRYQDERESELLARMQETLTRDALTTVHNRRYFLERLEQEYAYARRHRAALSVMLVDVDYFKRINDEYGHVEGDGVLAHIGQMLRKTVRTEDLVGRYGGDEFVIATRLDEKAAVAFGQRISRIIRSRPATVEGDTLHLSVSVGVCTLTHPQPKDPPAPTMMELVSRADSALYDAKRQGRDRVAVWARQTTGSA